MKFSLTNNSKLLKILPTLVLGLSLSFLCGAGYQAYMWWHAHQLNQAYDNKSIINSTLQSASPLQAYSKGYLLNNSDRNAKNISETINVLLLAESAKDEEIRARAKFAIGNLYFDLAQQSANIAAGGAHQQAVAQIELAREAYKGALRLRPNMYEARFNLELLDRQSPDKRTQGWQAETDGVTLQPFKRNGTASMRDNTRRGLP
jgi:tetratricopeptide (TPR) repeat protein